MAKAGRPSTLLEPLDESTRARIVEAIKSEQNVPYIDLYRRFALEQYGIKVNSFEKYARKVREEHQASADSLPLSSPPPSFGPGASRTGVAMATLMRGLEFTNRLIDANDVKSLPHASAMLRSLSDLIRLGFDEEAEKRASDKHEVWKTDVASKLRTQLDEDSKEGKTQYSREDVYDMVDKAMRGAL